MPSSLRVLSVAIVPLILVAPLSSATVAPQEVVPVMLTGRALTADDVVRVARGLSPVRADATALERVARSHQLLLLAAERGFPIYGLNRGVGIDRDKEIFRAGELDPAARRASERFNRNLLLAHSAGIGPDAPAEHVRAALLARVNTMLYGATGAQPAVAQMYLEFLNHRIHPVLPSRGSIGEGDIDILAHVGLAMMGEGTVMYQGRRVRAALALREAGLVPLVPFAKDGLSILSSNAYAAGAAALLVHDARRLLDAGEVVAALSLEGLNGNVSPLLEPVQALRPFPQQVAAAQRIRGALEGSYLWRPHPGRLLQDPLSFRTMGQVYGSAREQLQALEGAIAIQLNSSDDNPAVVLDATPDGAAPPVVRAYYVAEGGLKGAVFPSANFEPMSWVIAAEGLSAALRHVSSASVQRMTRLGTSSMTGLAPFLAPDDSAMAFAEAQYPYLALDAEVRALSLPVSADAGPAAGGIEDVSSNAPLVVERTARIVDDLYYILGMELLHAAQAVDLRRRTTPTLELGRDTARLHSALRRVVPFLDRDRAMTDDIRQTYELLRAQ